MTGVHDVAQALLARCGTMDTWALQKLCYYVQGFHLARTDRPAYSEQVKAWADGPVVPQLFHSHKGQRFVTAIAGGDAENVPSDVRETISLVLSLYGTFEGAALRALTHSESPWLTARGDLPEGSASKRPITHAEMKAFFRTELESLNDVPEPQPGQDLIAYLRSGATA